MNKTESEIRKLLQIFGPEEPPPPQYTGVRKALLGFRHAHDNVWESQVFNMFRPSGLVIWGAPDKAILTQCVIANEMQCVAGFEPIPARFFYCGDNYQQIRKKVEEGQDIPGWPDFSIIGVGNTVRIILDMPKESIFCIEPEKVQIVMWGKCLKE